MCREPKSKNRRYTNFAIKGAVCLSCRYYRRIERYGICRRCYYDLEIRERFRPKDINGNHIRHDFNDAILIISESMSRCKIPKEPTNYLPGTKEKIEVMRQRVERGEHIHHPLDLWLGKQVDNFWDKAPEEDIEDEDYFMEVG